MSFWDQIGNVASMGLFLGAQSNDAESAYIQQLQGIVNGTGPNPAQAMLAQQTSRNEQAAAGAIGGTRGMSPALRERAILEQRAGIQQNAVGQAATLQAQQGLEALGDIGNAINSQRAQNQSASMPIINGVASGLSSGLGSGSLGGGGGSGGGNTSGPSGGYGDVTSAMNNSGVLDLSSSFAHGGEVPGYLKQHFDDGGQVGHSQIVNFLPMLASLLSQGGPVPGRAKTAGDSPQNDTVDAKLSPGEIVLPRSVVDGDDAPARAAAFVEEIKRKHMAKNMPSGGYARVVAGKRMMGGDK